MKKQVLYIVLLVFGASACKKEYQCECTWNSGGNAGKVTTLQSGKISKKEAQDWCSESEEAISYADGTCVLN